MLFHKKIGILGKCFYVNHTFFILYLEGNHNLFGEKLYFSWASLPNRRVRYSPNKTSGGIFAEKSIENLIYLI